MIIARKLPNVLVRLSSVASLIFLLSNTLPATLAAGASRAPAAIWVNDVLYDTIGTPTSFKNPPEHSTDVIFSFAESGLDGQRSIAELAPGDPGYNGGRWRVMAVTFTMDALDLLDMDGDGAIDSEITNAEQLEALWMAGLVTIVDSGIRFECPLLPRRGHN